MMKNCILFICFEIWSCYGFGTVMNVFRICNDALFMRIFQQWDRILVGLFVWLLNIVFTTLIF